jgi:hypothetical protein
MIRQTTSKYPAVWRIINGQNIDFRPELLSKRKISAALISQSHWGRQLAQPAQRIGLDTQYVHPLQ